MNLASGPLSVLSQRFKRGLTKLMRLSVPAFCRPLPPKGNDGMRTGGKDVD